MMLPFQLWEDLRWVTIPGCIFAAYIILGIAAIGREIENPFGMDVNDLRLESYCEELETDIDVLMSQPAPLPREYMRARDGPGGAGNMVLWPLSHSGFAEWAGRSKQEIRDALMTKTKADMNVRKSMTVARLTEEEKMHHAAVLQQQDA